MSVKELLIFQKLTLDRLIQWTIFGMPEWLRNCLFFLTCVALSFFSYFIYNNTENEYLLVNFSVGCLAVSLFIRERRAWPTTLVLGFVGLILGVFLVGSASASSLTTVSIDVVVALLIALLSRRALRVSVRSRRISKISLLSYKNYFLVTTQVGGVLLVCVVVMNVLQNVPALASPSSEPLVWLLSRLTGILILTTIAAGVILEFHWGISKLPSKWLPFPLVFAAIIGAYWFALTHLSESHTQNPPATVLLFLGIVLSIMPSLWQAGSIFLILVAMWLPKAITLLGQVPVSAYLFVITLSFIQITVILGRILRLRSQREWHAAINEGPFNLIGLDDNGIITYLNDGMSSVFRIDTNTAIGQKISEIFPISLETDPKETLENLPIGECIVVHSDGYGSERKFRAQTTRISDPSLSFSRVASLRDVTAEKQLERERSEVQEVVDAFMQYGPQYFSLEDSDYRTVAISEAAAQDLVGLPVSEVIGRDTAELGAVDKDAVWKRRKEEALLLENKTGITCEYTAPNIAAERGLRHLRTHIAKVPRPNGDHYFSLVTEDLTELVEKRQALERALQNSEALLAAGTSAYTVVDENFERVLMSEQAMELFGYSDAQDVVPYLKMYKNLTEEKRQAQLQKLRELETGKILQFSEIDEIHTPDGPVLRFKRSSRWFPNPLGEGRLLWTNIEDVTELEEQRRYTETLLNRNASMILTQDKNWKILSCSEAWIDRLGYSREETLGRDLIDFMPPEEAEKSRLYREELIKSGNTDSIHKNKLQLLTKSGDLCTVELQSVSEVINGEWRNILTIVDITDLMRTQDQLTRLVERDTLTGLLSRRGLSSRFMDRQRLKDAGLFILDVDHFKSVNDSYGHAAGDELLKAHAGVLGRLTEDYGCALRLGGEEFAVVRPWSGWEEAYTFAETLRKAFAETEIEVNGRHIQRTASIGFAELRKGADLSEVMKLADIMQREAKVSGRNKVIGADPKTLALLEARGIFITNKQVQEALERGELSYYVQPIWNTKKNAIEGFEALIRWQKSNGTLVLPAQFVDVLYVLIREPHYSGMKAKLCRDVVAKLGDFPGAYVSFNYKLEQISFAGAAALIDAELCACRDHPNRQLVIEISEAAINDRVESDVLVRELEALKGFGYLIALDDFGVESSNIQRLQDYPIDIVKLDKILVEDLELSAKRRSTMTALSIMLTNLRLKVIVEGVETLKQAEFIAGCELFSQQGYLHARPMRPTEVAPNLASIGADIGMPPSGGPV